jgi:hypothetical protein
MEYIGFGILALVLLVGGWYVSRLLSRTPRNDGSTHGGGYGGVPPGVG